MPTEVDRATLPGCARTFFAQPSPLVITAALMGALAARLAVGGWSWWDLLGPAILLAVQPFTEWTIHVFLLHFRPRTIGSRRIDPLVSRKHREHHADPKDLGLVFVPMPTLLALIVGVTALFVLALPLERGLTVVMAAMVMLLTYEWTHYLIHSSYRPRHKLYRYVWRAHRNHHFRNENYWFGVTMHMADHVLRTFPERSAVELSPTARTLGVEDRLSA